MGVAAISEPAVGCIERTIPLPGHFKPVLAMGAWFKNTLCVVAGNEAHVSPSLGDLDTPEACRAHEQAAHAMLDWLGDKPAMIAHDLHPDFYSSQLAARLSMELQVPLLAVQHHHAHIAAVCAEHGVDQPLLGLALDGVGLGTDAMAWGGELLRVERAAFRRLGHLHPLPLPGGDRAAREPWRMAAAAMHELGRNDEIVSRFPAEAGAQTLATMLQRNVHCPRTSSMGRLFDAAAGLLGLCDRMEFEAQAAILLECAAKEHGAVAPLVRGYVMAEDGVLDFRPLLGALIDCRDMAHGAALFHATVADGLAQWVTRAARLQKLDIVALGGGCFLNSVLTPALASALVAHGLTVLKPRKMAPGDSAIALGQAWVALHYSAQGKH